ncbi:MAG: DNA mismatch repair protein MutS [Treponema sp.]|nr:DNA mismatch repair protein MutS [Treponema sp.]
MLDQYRRIKREHQGSVLFFRLGDFYEMFAEDAMEVSSLLNLTLTSRAGVPMCGVPYHACQNYISRLLNLGKKIAVCEQISEPGKTKLIDRQVVEIITPGTTVDENYLEKGSANYLACLAAAGPFLSFAYIDLSVGSFFASSFPVEQSGFFAGLELERLEIREIIAAESLLEEKPELSLRLQEKAGLVINRWADWLFDRKKSFDRLCRQFGTASLKGFGLEENSPEIIAAGALLDYLDDTAKSLIPHVHSISIYGDNDYTAIDESTQCNLELVRNLRDGTEQYSLFEVLNETKTAMGRRFLRRRLLHPLKDVSLIHRRLSMVEQFYRDQDKLGAMRSLLSKTPDLERLSSRLAMDKANGKDMASIMNALVCLEKVKQTILEKMTGLFEAPEVSAFNEKDFLELEKVCSLLERGLCENPSVLFSEGNLIREGYNQELDELNKLKKHGRNMLEKYLETEKINTGIPNLKINYNRLIGYYFEVTKINLSKVPSYFIRRQGIAAGERFSTEQLAKLESDINGASGRIIELEKKLFLELREKIKPHLGRISAAAGLIAELDAGQSLAWAATIRGWVLPAVVDEPRTIIIEGRHPVVEVHLPGGEFIPNDIRLEGEGIFFALITGPNMAGKSTYLRQAALITIMAQIGSFVPAREALIGITDRIYCRVGASDNLARGESTFLVEMTETAHILHTATERSLVIMDEVGRGTGTSDGLAIAWAVCEDLLHRVKCRTLFATHFHELSRLEHPGLANRSMEVLEQKETIVFLRKLKEGPSAESYGLYAAGLAGIPAAVLGRAGTILNMIRKKDNSLMPAAAENPCSTDKPWEDLPGTLEKQCCKTGDTENQLMMELSALEIDSITPLEAFNLIHCWKDQLKKITPEEDRKPRIKPAKQNNQAAGLSLFD